MEPLSSSDYELELFRIRLESLEKRIELLERTKLQSAPDKVEKPNALSSPKSDDVSNGTTFVSHKPASMSFRSIS